MLDEQATNGRAITAAALEAIHLKQRLVRAPKAVRVRFKFLVVIDLEFSAVIIRVGVDLATDRTKAYQTEHQHEKPFHGVPSFLLDVCSLRRPSRRRLQCWRRRHRHRLHIQLWPC